MHSEFCQFSPVVQPSAWHGMATYLVIKFNPPYDDYEMHSEL